MTTSEPAPEDLRRSGARREILVAGACATALSLTFMWLVSSLWQSVAFAPEAVANLVVRVTPGAVSTFFIDALGHWALRLMSLGVVLGTIAFGGALLLRTTDVRGPRPLMAAALLVVFGGVAALGIGSGTTSSVGTVIVLLLGGLVYALTADRLFSNLTAAHDPTRRRALRVGVGGAAAASIGGGVAGWLLRSLAGPDRSVALVAPVAAAEIPSRAAFPDIDGLTPEVTSPEDHYVVDIDLIKPSVETKGWSLAVVGEVDNPLELDFAALQERFEVVQEYSVLTCVSNEVGGNLIGHSAWGGVRLADVLKSAGYRDGAVDVVLRAADGYSDSISLEAAMDRHVLLAVSQNGEPLLQEHGFPCRLRVPFIYGMKNVKWLTEIEVVGSDYEGYWQQRGWSDEAVIKTESRIDVAGRDRSARRGEETWIAGIAWAGNRGISKVEVSVDSGDTWDESMLKEPISDLSWRLWAYRWTPQASGRTTVVCRATDGNGDVQVAKMAEPHPNGASGYPSVEVEVA